MNVRLTLLFLANIALAAGLGWTLYSSSESQASPGLQVWDLTYGSIDCDGDGRCTPGDDWLVEWPVSHAPRVLEIALKSAVVRDDGTVDLSPHLRTYTAEKIEAQRSK